MKLESNHRNYDHWISDTESIIITLDSQLTCHRDGHRKLKNGDKKTVLICDLNHSGLWVLKQIVSNNLSEGSFEVRTLSKTTTPSSSLLRECLNGSFHMDLPVVSYNFGYSTNSSSS